MEKQADFDTKAQNRGQFPVDCAALGSTNITA